MSEVLPRLDVDAMCELLRRLPRDELREAIESRIVRAVSLPGLTLHAVSGHPAARLARRRGLKLVGHAEPADFAEAVHRVHGRTLLRIATWRLARRWPRFSAHRRMTGAQLTVLVALLALIALGAARLPAALFLAIAAAVSGGFFLGVVALRLLCLMPRMRRRRPAQAEIADQDWPVYSVLVPLFREVRVLDQLAAALGALRYPEDRLDIKLILEEDDVAMQRAVADLTLGPCFEVIIVPRGQPQTKPRALNYALQFCRGSLLTIYDAEDIPDPDQLRKAARRFAAAPESLACLQAQLAFYNPDENWLTRQFTAEYATWFGEMLHMLANHNLPLPLGGTSNHFRMKVLRRVGAWDPHNVTEDADLGLRLARLGYETEMLDSITREEANLRLGNWMRQRARWLKGFLATWLVHMREPLVFLRDVGPSGFWVAQVLTLGVVVSVLLHPICLAATLSLWLHGRVFAAGAGVAYTLLAGLNLMVLVMGYATAFLLTRRALRRRGMPGWHGTLATMPVYWLLMSLAAWLALWQFITAPFHWNKTEHGLSLSRNVRRKRPRGTA